MGEGVSGRERERGRKERTHGFAGEGVEHLAAPAAGDGGYDLGGRGLLDLGKLDVGVGEDLVDDSLRLKRGGKGVSDPLGGDRKAIRSSPRRRTLLERASSVDKSRRTSASSPSFSPSFSPSSPLPTASLSSNKQPPPKTLTSSV